MPIAIKTEKKKKNIPVTSVASKSHEENLLV